MKIIVSRPIPGPCARYLRDQGFQVEVLEENRPQKVFVERFRDCDGVIPLLSDTIDSSLVASAPGLRCIANYAVGFNNVDLNACTAAGVPVTNTPDVLTDATADLTLTLILMAARKIPAAERYIREGRFDGWKPDFLLGLDLKGKTLGILGMGRIGRAVARRAEAFGMRIIYHTLSGAKADLPYPNLSLSDLLARSDVVSLHAPLTQSTRGLIGARELGMMKRGSILVNTARGPIVDEKALAAALASGHLFAAGLDVFEKEPEIYPDLLRLENVVILPHVGSATIETRSEMGMIAASCLSAGLSGQRPPNTVNPEVFGTPMWKSREKGT